MKPASGICRCKKNLQDGLLDEQGLHLSHPIPWQHGHPKAFCTSWRYINGKDQKLSLVSVLVPPKLCLPQETVLWSKEPWPQLVLQQQHSVHPLPALGPAARGGTSSPQRLPGLFPALPCTPTPDAMLLIKPHSRRKENSPAIRKRAMGEHTRHAGCLSCSFPELLAAGFHPAAGCRQHL